MKKYSYIALFLISSFTACQFGKVSDTHYGGLDMKTYYVENKLSFFDPHEITYANFRYTGHTYEDWIRRPENMKMVHETFKKIGYKKLFERFNYSTYCGFIHDVYKPCDVLIDSLILTYQLDTIKSRYYREFWNRRKKENNDQSVFEILKEVSLIVYKDSVIPFNENLANDTLQRLLEIRDLTDSVSTKQAHENFNYLKSIGMHHSAYNLLYERYSYYDVEWDKENLKSTLLTDTIDCCPSAFIIDNTK